MADSYLANPTIIETLIKYNADVDKADCFGETAVSYAMASTGPIKTLQVLLKNGASLNPQNRCRNTALHRLCKEKDTNMEYVNFLIDNRADVNNINRAGSAPLNEAVKDNNEKLVACLLKSGAAIKLVRDPDDSTDEDDSNDYLTSMPHYHSDDALFNAVNQKNIPIIKLLLDYKADISDLMKGNNLKLLKDILKRRDKISIDVMRLLLDNNRSALTAPFVEEGLGQTTLLRKAYDNNNEEAVKLLLEYGADPNNREGDGWTPLLYIINKK